jgi:hypothetical protein
MGPPPGAGRFDERTSCSTHADGPAVPAHAIQRIVNGGGGRAQPERGALGPDNYGLPLVRLTVKRPPDTAPSG